MIAIEKITPAYTDLIEAMDITAHLKLEGIESAWENIAELGQLSAERQQRANSGTTGARGSIC